MAERQPRSSSIQDIVYNLDVGSGLQLLRSALYVAGILLLMLIYTATQFNGFHRAEPMELAQIGRNLAFGRGYTTKVVRPATLSILEKRGQTPAVHAHPDLFHAPGYAVATAAYNKLAGVQPAALSKELGAQRHERWIVFACNHTFILMTGVLVYLLGRRLFNARTAFWSTTVFFLSDAIWSASIRATGLGLLIFLVTAAFASLLWSRDLREGGQPLVRWGLLLLLAGVFAGLAGLTRYGALAMLPGLVLFARLLYGPGGWRHGTVVGVVALAVVAPWIARNVLVCGRPFGLTPWLAFVDETRAAVRTLEPRMTLPMLFSRPALGMWLGRIAKAYQGTVRNLGEGLVGVMAVMAFFAAGASKEVRSLRWAALLGLLGMLVIGGWCSEEGMLMLLAFTPLVLLVGVGFFFSLLGGLQLRVRLFELALLTLFVLSAAAPLIFALLPPAAKRTYPPYYPPFITYVTDVVAPQEVLCSDMPWATAWYGDRTSLELPIDIDEFFLIHDYRFPVVGIYFTTISGDLPYTSRLLTGVYKTWLPVMRGQTPMGFPLTHGRRLNNMDQLFLADWPRWERYERAPAP